MVPPALGRVALVGFNAGPRGDLYFISALGELDYTTQDNGFATFPKTVPDSPQQYRVQSSMNGHVDLDIVVSNERFNIHDIQPMGDELLLACARSRRRSAEDFDRNGRVYGRDGVFRREFLLGDGVATIQSTCDGQIWSSYFDEGVFGNYGWREPVGASGIVAWNFAGEKLYDFEAPEEAGFMADCYALNVAADDDVWCCYYTDFPLVRIKHREIASVWRSPVHGSHAFAIADGYVVFAGAYNEPDLLHLVELDRNEKATLIDTFQLVDSNEEPVSVQRIVGRGKMLYALAGETIHVINADDVIARR